MTCVPSLISRRGFVTGSAVLIAANPALALPDTPDIAAIAARGTLRVALPSFDASPFFQVVNGSLTGIDIALAQRIATQLGVTPSFDRSAASFNDTVEAVASGAADMALCKLSRTLSRARSIRFTAPYAQLSHALIVNRLGFARIAADRPPEDVVRGFDRQLGVIKASAYAEYARSIFPAAIVREYPNWPEVVAAVEAGGVVAAYRDEFEIKRLLIDHPELTIDTRTATLTDLSDSIAIGLAHDASGLAAWLEVYLSDQNRPMQVGQILRRYESAINAMS